MQTDSEPNVAQDAETIIEAIAAFEAMGYVGQFAAIGEGRIRCFSCRTESEAHDVAMDRLARLEGASDPADTVAVVALTCPNCSAQGTLVLNYGPDAPPEESDVLVELNDVRDGPSTTDSE